jgi:hypothetical protein
MNPFCTAVFECELENSCTGCKYNLNEKTSKEVAFSNWVERQRAAFQEITRETNLVIEELVLKYKLNT